MKEPRNDDERLSALLDGRLHGREREELLAHLSASEADRHVFTDTAAILRELEEEDAAGEPEPGVIPLRPARPRWWRHRARWGALAAVLAAITLVAVVASRGRASAAADPVRLAARLDGGLPDRWTEQRPWASTRGPGAAGEPGARAAEAAHAGALLVDLAVAVEARDAAHTRLLAEQVRSRFDPRSGDAGPLRQLAERAGAPPDSLRPLVQSATKRLGDLLGREPLRLGAWAEAGLLAADRHDEAFFRAAASRRMLDAAGRLTAADPVAREALTRVRAALPPRRPPDWQALTAALDDFLSQLAG